MKIIKRGRGNNYYCEGYKKKDKWTMREIMSDKFYEMIIDELLRKVY